MARVCIVCQKEVSAGYPVEDDAVIRAIRKAKQSLKMAKNNELVVEESCLEAHKKKREKFEKDLVMHVVVGAIILIIFTFLPVFSPSGFSLQALVLGVVLAALVVGLSVFSHWPKIAQAPKAAVAAGPGKAAAKGKKTKRAK